MDKMSRMAKMVKGRTLGPRWLGWLRDRTIGGKVARMARMARMAKGRTLFLLHR